VPHPSAFAKGGKLVSLHPFIKPQSRGIVTHKLAVFASLNQVALVKRALHREGVYVEMLRTPRCLSHTGCSFALRCRVEELSLLDQVCRQWKIEPGGFFKDTKDSTPALDNELLDE
jgi:hypothetical protein